MSEKKDLTELRSEIDSIDRELMRLFEERMNISRQVGDYKRERGLPVFDETREKEVIAARTALIGEEALRPYASRLMHNIMDYSKEVQKRPGGKVAFQGCRGAYSEEAARTYFPDAELAAKEQFEDVFRAVARGEAEAGVVPVENSAAGSVTANIDLLGRYDLSVQGEVLLPIRHVLLGAPGASLSDIGEVYSHEQAIRQCSAYLAGHTNWTIREYPNTAMSAKYVAECGDKSKAAIASAFAGEVYGLVPLERDISDSMENFTRFFVLSRQSGIAEGADKASLLFTLNHVSGSLAKVLSVFGEKGYNLTKIESRPILGRNWEYKFYVDVEGDIARLSEDMAQIGRYCLELRLIGGYRKAKR